MTPYGKNIIIKTLTLSKLSLAALVLPSLNKNKIKDLEKCIAQFCGMESLIKLPEKMQNYRKN